jgi:putative lipase involved disintegration of autophagic bodies
VDVDAIAQLDVATAAIAAQHVPAAPLWHRRHHKHANETNRFKIEEKRLLSKKKKIEEKRTQTNRFKIEEKRTFVSSVNKSTMITSKQCIASSYEQTSKFVDQIIKEA